MNSKNSILCQDKNTYTMRLIYQQLLEEVKTTRDIRGLKDEW